MVLKKRPSVSSKSYSVTPVLVVSEGEFQGGTLPYYVHPIVFETRAAMNNAKYRRDECLSQLDVVDSTSRTEQSFRKEGQRKLKGLPRRS